MAAIALTVNGRAHTLDVDPATPLLYVLSDDLALNGPKFGCGLGPVRRLHRHRPTAARSAPASRRSARSNGAEITTLEGLGTVEQPHPIQQAFIDEQAAQCGFCLNGVILTAKAFLDQNPKPSDAQIQQAMSTVLCRCFTHTRMLARRSRRVREGEKKA